MTASPKYVNSYPACTTPSANDVLLGQGNNKINTYSYSVKDLLGNSAANVIVANSMVLSTNTFLLRKSNTPANSTAGGHPNNSLFFDDNYGYRVLANGFIKRFDISSF